MHRNAKKRNQDDENDLGEETPSSSQNSIRDFEDKKGDDIYDSGSHIDSKASESSQQSEIAYQDQRNIQINKNRSYMTQNSHLGLLNQSGRSGDITDNMSISDISAIGTK